MIQRKPIKSRLLIDESKKENRKLTLIAWGAGLLLDANIHFGDPQGFLCLRVLLPVLAMGLCLLRAIKENKRDGDK